MRNTHRLEACPLCGYSVWRELATPGRWIGPEVFGGLEGQLGLVRCLGCALTFINPRPSDERLAAFYSGSTYSCHDTGGSASAGAHADLVLARIAKHLPAGAPRTLLDYGAGGGGFLLHARARGWDVRGFEPGRRGRESCRAAGLEVIGDLAELEAGAFGVVTLHHVFEHLADPVGALAEVRRLLSPGGVLFVEVPNVQGLRARLAFPALSRRYAVDERHRAFPIHLAYYSGATLRRMLARGGFSVAATMTMGMGVDEYLIRPPREAGPARTPGPAPRPPAKRRLRHVVRDAFLASGLGENLAALAL